MLLKFGKSAVGISWLSFLGIGPLKLTLANMDLEFCYRAHENKTLPLMLSANLLRLEPAETRKNLERKPRYVERNLFQKYNFDPVLPDFPSPILFLK